MAMSILKKVLNAVKKFLGGAVKSKRKKSGSRKKGSRPRKIKKSPAVLKSPARVIKKKVAKKIAKSPRPSIETKSKASEKSKTVPLKETPPKKIPSVGAVTHFFDKIKVCVIRIDHGVIKKGDRLRIEGKNGSVIQDVVSMQIENEDVVTARKGQLIGLKVKKTVHVGDVVEKM